MPDCALSGEPRAAQRHSRRTPDTPGEVRMWIMDGKSQRVLDSEGMLDEKDAAKQDRIERAFPSRRSKTAGD